MDIHLRRFDGPAPGPHLLITAGVHGDEWVGMEACRHLIAFTFADNPLIRGSVTIVPCLNAGAFARVNRVGVDGLDLARTFPGRPDGSETERLAHAAAALIRSADAFIDLHTCGIMGDILGLAGYMLHPDPAVLDMQRQMARAFNLPIIWGTTPKMEGRSLSAARDAGVPAIYTELGGGAGCDPDHVAAYIQGCLNVALLLGLVDLQDPGFAGYDLSGPAVQDVVEDSRDHSGHLQRMHPAPCAGYWKPALPLGSKVEAGDLVGLIVGPLGENLAVITATESGIILFRRELRSCQPGDTLLGILETTCR